MCLLKIYRESFTDKNIRELFLSIHKLMNAFPNCSFSQLLSSFPVFYLFSSMDHIFHITRYNRPRRGPLFDKIRHLNVVYKFDFFAPNLRRAYIKTKQISIALKPQTQDTYFTDTYGCKLASVTYYRTYTYT